MIDIFGYSTETIQNLALALGIGFVGFLVFVLGIVFMKVVPVIAGAILMGIAYAIGSGVIPIFT